MFGGNGLSLADIAAVTGNDRSNDGFGDGGWWAWIILFALFGWGGGGFGGFGSGGGGTQSSFTDAAIQRGFDNSAVIGKLDRLGDGIASLGYDQLAQLNAVNSNISQTGFGLQNAINGVGQQVSDCCCTTQRSLDQVRFDAAQNTCATNNAITSGFAQLDRTLNDKFCELQMRTMQSTIDQQQSTIQSLNLAASQAAQNSYLVNALRPAPVPSYNVPNPYAGTGYGCGCGCS